MKIVVIDYQIGNLLSVTGALTALGRPFELDTNGQHLRGADLLIVPGVASFGNGIRNLNQFSQFNGIKTHHEKGKAIIGLCLGAQILLESSQESPGVNGLGLVKGESVLMDLDLGRVPNQGWQQVNFAGTRLERYFPNDKYFYFSHSFKMQLDEKLASAMTIKGESVVGYFEKGNIHGIQFHPERSGEDGLFLLDRVLDLARMDS